MKTSYRISSFALALSVVCAVGHLATADDENATLHFHRFAQTDGPQEGHALSNAVRIFARDADFLRCVRADGQHNGFVPLLK